MTIDERFQKIENALAVLGEHSTRSAEHLIRHDERLEKIGVHLERLVDIVGSLAETQEGMQAAQARTEAEIGKLTEAQAQTDYKLNALIDTVDRIVRGGKP